MTIKMTVTCDCGSETTVPKEHVNQEGKFKLQGSEYGYNVTCMQCQEELFMPAIR